MGWARIAPEQHLLEFGTLNDTWHLWDLRTRREIYVLRPDTNVLSWTFLPSGMKLLEYTREMKLQFRHLPGGEVEPFLAHDFGEGANVELEASSDGRVILGVTRADVRVWDMPTKTQTYNFQPTDLKNWDGFALSPDNKSVFARVGPRLSVWQLDTLENSVLGGHRILVNSWGFLRDGHRFTSTSEEGTVMLRDFRDSREPLVFNCGLGGCSFVSLSWDEKRLVLPTWAGVIQLWDVASNRQIAALRACNYRQLVCAAAFLDENTLASVFDDELRLWRAPSWAEIEREEATRASVAPTKEEWK
jgi:WD40 repeat protein